MKRSFGRLAPAFIVVLVAAVVVVSCGQVPTANEATKLQPQIQGPLAVSQGDAEACDVPTASTCTPTGAHQAHGGFACSVCHVVAGRVAFDVNGPAYPNGWTSAQPRPRFDAVGKTCSNVACHGMISGTFSYYFPGGDGEPALNTVNIAGSAGRPTPSWYATGAIGCTACHDNPPRNGSDGSNVWHSGYHGGQGPTGAYNQCQFCHPDATGTNGQGTSITNASLHGNGVFNVQARFTSACFGCH